MSNDDNERKNQGKINKVLSSTVDKRRELQHQELKKWDRGQTTARQCIESILEIEKLIFYDMRRGPNG